MEKQLKTVNQGMKLIVILLEILFMIILIGLVRQFANGEGPLIDLIMGISDA